MSPRRNPQEKWCSGTTVPSGVLCCRDLSHRKETDSHLFFGQVISGSRRVDADCPVSLIKLPLPVLRAKESLRAVDISTFPRGFDFIRFQSRVARLSVCPDASGQRTGDRRLASWYRPDARLSGRRNKLVEVLRREYGAAQEKSEREVYREQ